MILCGGTQVYAAGGCGPCGGKPSDILPHTLALALGGRGGPRTALCGASAAKGTSRPMRRRSVSASARSHASARSL